MTTSQNFQTPTAAQGTVQAVRPFGYWNDKTNEFKCDKNSTTFHWFLTHKDPIKWPDGVTLLYTAPQTPTAAQPVAVEGVQRREILDAITGYGEAKAACNDGLIAQRLAKVVDLLDLAASRTVSLVVKARAVGKVVETNFREEGFRRGVLFPSEKPLRPGTKLYTATPTPTARHAQQGEVDRQVNGCGHGILGYCTKCEDAKHRTPSTTQPTKE